MILAALVALHVIGAEPQRGCDTMRQLAQQQRGFRGGFGERPSEGDLEGFVDSAAHPLRVHFQPGAGAEAAQALALLDAEWVRQTTDGAGVWAPPLPDGVLGGDASFDVYLVQLPAGISARTTAEADADPADGRHASPAFLEITTNLGADTLAVTCAHELHHALQFAVDTRETIGFLEMDATLHEIRAQPDIAIWKDALRAFQEFPQASLFADSFSVDAVFPLEDKRFEYGAVLLALYLDEVHGAGDGALLHDLLVAAADDSVDENEPDWLDVLEPVVGISPAQLTLDFASWRALVATFEDPDDGPIEEIAGNGRLNAGAVTPDALDGTVHITETPQGPYPLGCVVREIVAPVGAALPVHVTAEARDAGRVLGAATMIAVAGSGETARDVAAEPAPALAFDLDIPPGAHAQISLCDVTDVDPDAPLVLHPIAFSFLRTDIDFPDAGPGEGEGEGEGDGDAPPAPTCGCSTSARGPAFGVAFVALTCAWTIRRRTAR